MCVLCQQNSSKIRLVCPAESKLPVAGAGYETLAHDLMGFSEIGSLPNNIDLSLLDDGSGIPETLSKSNARWHKCCRDKFNATKLHKAQEKKILR